MTAASRGDIKAIVAGLSKSRLLASLSDRELKQLASFAVVKDLPKDTVVVQKGDKGIGFYVVLEGQLMVSRGGKGIARLGPGDFFGELALFQDHPRSADVSTVEPTTVLVLSRWEFWGFASQRPEVLRTILEVMAHRLDQSGSASTP